METEALRPKKDKYAIVFVLNVHLPTSTEVESLDDSLRIDTLYGEIRDLVGIVLGDERPREPLARARIKFTLYSSKEPDHWELVTCFTPVRQALCSKKIVRFAAYEFAEYYWRRAKANQGCIEVSIEEVT